MRKLTKKDVEFTITAEPEDMPIRGNCLASGDAAADKALEDELIERVNNGDEWAWCCAHVQASVTLADGTKVYGDDYLGGCSYASEADFTKDDYYRDMCNKALSDLQEKLEAMVKSGELVKDFLKKKGA